LYRIIGYIGGTTSFQDVINKAAAELFCAATPNPDASQVQNSSICLDQLVTKKLCCGCEINNRSELFL